MMDGLSRITEHRNRCQAAGTDERRNERAAGIFALRPPGPKIDWFKTLRRLSQVGLGVESKM